MSLVDAITAELPALRAQAESLMVDTCTITSGAATRTYDTNTRTTTTTEGATIYSGKCRVQVTDSVTTTGENVGEQLVITERVTISIPVNAVPVPLNSVITITAVADISDPTLVDRKYRVTGSHAGTHKTARRLPCEQVSA